MRVPHLPLIFFLGSLRLCVFIFFIPCLFFVEFVFLLFLTASDELFLLAFHSSPRSSHLSCFLPVTSLIELSRLSFLRAAFVRLVPLLSSTAPLTSSFIFFVQLGSWCDLLKHPYLPVPSLVFAPTAFTLFPLNIVPPSLLTFSLYANFL